MTDDLVEIYRAHTVLQGRLLVDFLEREGIDAYLENEAIQPMGGWIGHNWSLAPRVMVRVADEQRALAFAAEFERIDRLEPKPDFGDPAHDEIRIWPGWPVCPNCKSRRLATCPSCGETSRDFGLAHGEAESTFEEAEESSAGKEGHSRPLLECSNCDEPFRPRFHRACDCGHDFGDGVESAARVAHREPIRMDWKVTIAVVLIFAVFAGLIAVMLFLGPIKR